LNLPASYSMGRFFGLYIAKGHTSEGRQAVWSLHREEATTLWEEIKNILSFVGLPWCETFLDDGGCQLSTSNKLLIRFLQNVFGEGAEAKKIGLDLSRYPREFLLGLADGYFVGDGSLDISKNAVTLHVSSVSRVLVEQMRFLLSLLGITSSVRKEKGGYGKGSNIQDSWTLDIRRADIKHLPAYSEIDTSGCLCKPSTSKRFGFESDEFVACRVRSVCVEENIETDWVDIAIENPFGEGRFTTVYGIVHNSDVAPWSREYAMFDRIISKQAAEGRLSAEETLEVQRVKRQVAETKKGKNFQQYRYDSDLIKKVKVRIVDEIEPGRYLTDTFGSAPISLTGLNTDTASLAGIAMREDSSIAASDAMRRGKRKRAQLSDYLRQYVYPGAEIDVYVHRDPSALMQRGISGVPEVKAVMSVGGHNLNRALVEEGLAESMATGEPLDPMMATGGIQRAFGSWWEKLAHGAETPLESFTPLAPVAKYIHQRTALEEYQRDVVYGRDVSLWQKPITHFLAPGLSTTAWWAGFKSLPRETQEKYMIEDYFDRLEYMKWKRVEQAAAARGDGELAADAARGARRTATGVNRLAPRSARLALPSYERVYFDEFVRSPSAAERREISSVVSPQMREILHAQWARREAEAAEMRMEAGIGGERDLQSASRFRALTGVEGQRLREAEQEAAIENLPVPGPNWVGWDPNADIRDYRVKTIHDAEMDAPSYGIWRSDIRRVERMPWVTPISAAMEPGGNIIPSPMDIRRRMRRVFGMSGGSFNGDLLLDGGGHRDLTIESPGYDRLHRYLGDPSIMQF